jgi:FlaA1/EpsC-like NDP-sugar epimerase
MERAKRKILRFPHVRARIAFRVLVDTAVLSLAIWLAFALRFEGDLGGLRFTRLLIAWPLAVGLQVSMLAAFGVPRFSWSFVGLREFTPVCRAILAAAAVLLAMRYGLDALVSRGSALRFLEIPVSIILIDGALALLGLAGMRGLRRLQTERAASAAAQSVAAVRTILVGAGYSGSWLAQELRRRPALGIDPVAFVDDDPLKTGTVLHGLSVAGTSADLAEIARTFRAEMVLIAIASRDGGSVQRITQVAEAAGLRVKIIPTLVEILSGKLRISQIRDVAVEDLLGRPPVVLEGSAAARALRGRVVLVTGAGGSIGSELCRQILTVEPSRLILLERCENNLYEIHRELVLTDPERVVPALADVRDEDRIRQVFAEHRPNVVFHAAAHKHVPMLEENPAEAVLNNVFGTRVVADVAAESGVERFVLISTDKAVNPSSVMGATKRLAELYVRELNGRCAGRFVSVRFGNVAGSVGSVIPLFREQIAKGGPVTVTHPDMERFFMTIPEASRLVLEAAGLGEGGETMLLDMGEPIKIRKLAEQMVRLSGFEPGVDIQIRFTGIRPGEKLQEELARDDESAVALGECEKVFVWRGGGGTAVPMAVALQRLREAATANSHGAIKAALREILPEYVGFQTVPPPAAPPLSKPPAFAAGGER